MDKTPLVRFARLDFASSRSWRILSLAVLLVLVVGFAAPAMGGDWDGLLAQSGRFSGRFPSQSGSAGWLSLDHWVTKAALILVALFAATLFCFLVVFRWLLSKGKPWWPLSAYGFCMSLVLTVTFAAGLALFWDELVIGDNLPAKPWWEIWGGRAAVIVVWLFVVSIDLAVFRSPHARKAS